MWVNINRQFYPVDRYKKEEKKTMFVGGKRVGCPVVIEVLSVLNKLDASVGRPLLEAERPNCPECSDADSKRSVETLFRAGIVEPLLSSTRRGRGGSTH